jgi:hypothetical protein
VVRVVEPLAIAVALETVAEIDDLSVISLWLSPVEEMVTTRSTPVVRARENTPPLSLTSADCSVGVILALAGVARPVIPMRATKEAAIARTKTEERLALTMVNVFSMRPK